MIAATGCVPNHPNRHAAAVGVLSTSFSFFSSFLQRRHGQLDEALISYYESLRGLIGTDTLRSIAGAELMMDIGQVLVDQDDIDGTGNLSVFFS